MDFQLKVFKTVVDRNSFSQAARELHMTQSSVSQHIQALENYYGVKLFDRLYRRIAITQAGQALYPFAVEIERIYQQAQQAMQGLTEHMNGRIRLGASLTVGEYCMPDILVAFSHTYPHVSIHMDIFNTEQIARMVIDGTLDVGFVEGPYQITDALTGQPCGGDDLVIICPQGSRFQHQVTSLEELLGEQWVMREKTSGTRRVFEQFIRDHGFDDTLLNIVMELGGTQAIKKSVQAGVGIAALSRLAVADDVEAQQLAIVPLQEGPIRRAFTLLYHSEKFRTYAIETFIAFVNEHLRLDREQPDHGKAE